MLEKIIKILKSQKDTRPEDHLYYHSAQECNLEPKIFVFHKIQKES